MEKLLLSVFTLSVMSSSLLANESFTIEEKWRKSYVDSEASNSHPTEFVSFNNQVFFVASDSDNPGEPQNRHLYALTPNTNQLSQIKDQSGNETSSVSSLKVFNNKLYFKQAGSTYSIDTNGLVQAENADFVFGVGSGLSINGDTYFVADLGVGKELYKLHQNTPQLLRDFNQGEADGVVSELALFNQSIYFSANDGSSQNLYKLDGITNEITNITDYQAGSNIEISSVVGTNGNLYFSQYTSTDEGSKIMEYKGASIKEIFQGKLSKFTISGANARLILSVEGGLSSEQCIVPDQGYSLAALDLKDNEVKCFIVGTSLDHSYKFDYQVLGNKVVIDEFSRGGMFSADYRIIHVYDFDKDELKQIYRVNEVCQSNASVIDLEYDCKLSYALANNNIYLSSKSPDNGIEVTAVSIDNSSVTTVDVNDFVDGHLSLRPIKANKNLLFIQPYASTAERKTFLRNFEVFDYLGEQDVPPSSWQQGESYLQHGLGVGPQISPRNFTPNTVFLDGVIETNVESIYSSFTAVSYQDMLYRLNFETNAKGEYVFVLAEGQWPISNKIVLDINMDGFEAPYSRITVPNVLMGERYFTVLPFSQSVEKLAVYDFSAKATVVIGEYEAGSIKQLIRVNDDVFVVKQDVGSMGVYQVTGDVLTPVHTMFSIEQDSGLKAINGDLYFIGLESAFSLPSLYKLSTVTQELSTLIQATEEVNVQSFAEFDNKVFFTNSIAGTEPLRFYDLTTTRISSVDLDNVTQPQDLIRYEQGIYFQALSNDQIPALYRLAIADKYSLPQVDTSQVSNSGEQGRFYTSPLNVSDSSELDLKVHVVEPKWLSYNYDTKLLEGTPQDPFELGKQDVTLTVDNGQLLAVKRYPLKVKEIVVLFKNYQARFVVAYFGQAYSHQLELSHNANNGANIHYSMEVIREDNNEVVDWLVVDSETGEISGTIPEITTEGSIFKLKLNVTVVKGGAKSTEAYTLFVEEATQGTDQGTETNNNNNSNNNSEQAKEESSGGVVLHGLLLFPLVLLRRRKCG